MRAQTAIERRAGRPGGWRLGQLLLALTLLMATLSGCKVQGKDIEYWKRTVKGPDKIVAVMLADKYPMELRVQAALALVEMDRQDLDGTAELQKALERLDEETRAQIVSGMVPGIQELMNRAPDREGAGVDPRQIRAKDAAFLLITNAPPEVRKQLTEAVVNWYVTDFNGRSLAGNYSAEQVVRALGSPAAKALISGLDAKLPQQALVKMAELIGQLGDAKAKAEAAKRLVEIEREMESQAFMDWLKKGVSDQLSMGGDKPDPKRVEQVAALNRENFILGGALSAMKWLADQKVVTDRLVEIASTPKADGVWVERRVKALQALEGKVSRTHLTAMLELATDDSVPPRVRDYAFDRVGDIRSTEALPKLWPLVGQTKDQRLRWRAGELALAIGGSGALDQFFSTLPEGEYAREEIEGYATRMGQMTPLPVSKLRVQLGSSNWWNRAIALHFFERKGSSEDIRRMASLTSDSAKVSGPRWGDQKTVGAIAKGSVEAAKARLSDKSDK